MLPLRDVADAPVPRAFRGGFPIGSRRVGGKYPRMLPAPERHPCMSCGKPTQRWSRGPNGIVRQCAYCERLQAGYASRERAYQEVDEEHARHERRIIEVMQAHAARLDALGLKDDAAEVRRQLKERAAR